jgi:hypothetical protein
VAGDRALGRSKHPADEQSVGPELSRRASSTHRLYTEYHERILAAVDTYLPVEKVMSIDENRKRTKYGHLRRSYQADFPW